MPLVPDWWIQVCWWASGIFATGGLWYFLSAREYFFAISAGFAAVIFAAVAIILHRKKDAQLSPQDQVQVDKDKFVTSQWWETSDLRKEYIARGLNVFRWSNAERVAERQQHGYEIVYLEDPVARIRYRIVNRSEQVLITKAGDA